MQTIIKSTALLVLLACSTTLLSFSEIRGGEGFEIYLDNKLLVQRFGNEMNKVAQVQLDSRLADSKITVKYHHCGKVGKNRVITLKNADNKILKQWKFRDVDQPYGAMSCNVQNILNVETKGQSQLNLYYASSELPSGRQLASIRLNKTAAAAAMP